MGCSSSANTMMVITSPAKAEGYQKYQYEMKYFQNVSIIDNILRDKYKCNEIIIEIIFLFYGKKVNFCGLTNNKFNIPPFNGIEDNWADTENFQTEFEIRTKWRSYDEIQTDINNAKENGNAFKMMIKA
eukprot:320349_1